MNTKQKTIAESMEAIGASIEVATFVAAQATLESGNFSSDIFNENKNFFGMKKAKCRPTTAIGTNRNHAMYKINYDCMIDYYLWLVYNGFNQNTLKDLDKFKMRLRDSGYCPLKDYIDRINTIYEEIKEN